MSRKRKLLNIRDRCRICLVDNGCTTSLFDEELQSKMNDLTKCTSIDIKDEHGLPNIVCYVCLYKLDMWNEFKEQFIRSNQMLLSQLEVIDASDDENLPLKKAHKELEQGGEDSLSDSSLKTKPQKNLPSLTREDSRNADDIRDQTMLNDMFLSDNDGTSSKDSSQKAADDKCKKEEKQENKNGNSLKSNSTSKTKPLTISGKRNMMERRMASTKRWVARKKALLAATGESVSDTDSMGSDDTELSPVQKARAKTNLDKEAEKQKRLIRTLKNSDTTLTDKCAVQNEHIIDTDFEARRKRYFIDSDSSSNESRCASLIRSKRSGGKKKDKKESLLASLPEKTAKEKSLKNDRMNAAQETFVPCFTKSELDVGDAKYIITSTLTPTESHYLNKENLNTLSKEIKNGSIEPNSREKNTDIIDAVQLRRKNPIPTDADKKCVERCLNIVIEGSEALPLRRVQLELAVFVQKEMKQRLFGGTDDPKDPASETLFESLNQQLKTIVEKAIKKNFENSVMKNCGINFKSLAHQSGTVSPDFVKAAVNSAKYQPRIVLKRLNIAKESQKFNINNVHAAFKRTVKGKLGGPFSMVSHKRQSVPPIRYNDYNTSALDSDSYFSESDTSRSENNRQNTLEHRTQAKQEEELRADFSDAKNEQKAETQENVFKVTSSSGEKHGCGVCGQAFDSRVEAIAHVRIHKAEAGSRANKHKMMRCKRCHEIVEARFVKAHVCKSSRQQAHKCYVCNSTFRTEKLLVQHLETHDQSEFSIDNVTKGEPQKLTPTKSDTVQLPKDNSRLEEPPSCVEQQSEETKIKEVPELERPKETYTCFVCDKIFTDEEILKDHLQKHCDDMSPGRAPMSEDDQSPGKEQYGCAICGESLESDDALDAHIDKHLDAKEDDNPDLINISNESNKSRDEVFQCLQCTEAYNSEMLLEMHMQAHEEEAAIAEWEKQGIKAYEFQCLICDELFETEDDLSEHLDIHNANAHVCQLCDKPFTTLEDLQNHVATH